MATPRRRVIPFPSDQLTVVERDPEVKQRVNVYLRYTTAEKLHQVRQAGIEYDASASAASAINRDVERLLGIRPGSNGHRPADADVEHQDHEQLSRIEQLVTAHHEEHQDQQRELSDRLDDLERRQLEAGDRVGVPDWLKALAAFAVVILALSAAGGFAVGYRFASA